MKLQMLAEQAIDGNQEALEYLQLKETTLVASKNEAVTRDTVSSNYNNTVPMFVSWLQSWACTSCEGHLAWPLGTWIGLPDIITMKQWQVKQVKQKNPLGEWVQSVLVAKILMERGQTALKEKQSLGALVWLEGNHLHGNADAECAKTRRQAKMKKEQKSQQGVTAGWIKRETFNRASKESMLSCQSWKGAGFKQLNPC